MAAVLGLLAMSLMLILVMLYLVIFFFQRKWINLVWCVHAKKLLKPHFSQTLDVLYIVDTSQKGPSPMG